MQFDFVTEKGIQRLKDRDSATQHLIRKRATQAAAKTKREHGNRNKVNLVQYPHWCNDNSTTKKSGLIETKLPGRTRSHLNSQSLSYEDPPLTYDPEIRLSSFTLSPIFSIQQAVSLLPSLRVQETLVGYRTSPTLTIRDKNRTRKLLRLTKSDFVTLMIDHHGQSKTLDAAIACLGARVRELVSTSPSNHQQLDDPDYHYGRALRHLKNDIDNVPTEGPNVETWLGILALALFELLNSADRKAWVVHSNAAALLLAKLGPHRVNNELYKTLLTIQIPIITTETLLSSLPCYLAEPAWQDAIRATILPDAELYDERGELLVSLMLLYVQIPNPFNAVSALVLTTTALDTDASALRQQLHTLRADLSSWRARHDILLHFKFPDVQSEDRRLYALASALLSSALVDRLLLAITPSMALELEHSANELAVQAIETGKSTSLSVGEARVRLAYWVAMAQSIVDTSPEWMEALCGVGEEGGWIEGNVWKSWCRRIGRPV